MATYDELMAQAEQLKKQAENVRLQEKMQIVTELREKIARFGITAKDLGFGGRASRQASGLRYRGPNGEIWSGKGRRPEWLRQALSEGRSKSDFVI
ncbi:MAG: H-NS histone family protein [Betaproteobacteria bacterium]|jgi:DNA-binding protein H-NS|nr:H-NS histone family protein [Betaproteobacteria bacterium]